MQETTVASGAVPRRAEVWFVGGAIAALLALRLLLIFRYRFDSDEPQHMHVAWGWSRGLMQYRDVFDNHMPLFHLLSAPLFHLAGENPRVLFLARVAMLPLFAAAIVLTWVIARRLFDGRTALWSSLLVSAFPPFFLGTLEYRTDDLWVVFWLASIAILVSAVPLVPRSAAGGLAIGLAFAVSMKTVLCALAIAAAAFATIALTRQRGRVPSRRTLLASAAAATVTACVIPAVVFLAFALAHAWRSFEYCVFLHNRIPYEHSWRLLWFVVLYPLMRMGASRIARSGEAVEIVRRRLFVFLACSFFFLALVAFWPMVAAESYLPFYPLAIVLLTPILVSAGGRHLVAAALLTSFAALIVIGAPWRNDADREVSLVREILDLTRSSDRVMDLKGETVFRRRPYWLVLEAITNCKYRLGLIPDQIARTLVETRTAVVASRRLPWRSRRFVQQNYLPWGRLWVAGRPVTFARGSHSAAVQVHLPSKYIVITGNGIADASIDGHPAGGGVELAAGRHSIVIHDNAREAAIIWSGVIGSRHFPGFARRAVEPIDRPEGRRFLPDSRARRP